MKTGLAHSLRNFLLAASLCSATVAVRASDPLSEGFANPPEQTKPWCYWYWISDNLSKEGITKDLEAMARVGIGEALMGNIFLDEAPAGKIKVLSEEWWQLVEHAIREGGRVGVNIGLFNCPGWSQSGGPWIRPEQSMRYLASSEIRVTGPQRFTGKLAAPATQFQDVTLLAFPAPEKDADRLAKHSTRLTCSPVMSDSGNLLDGKADTAAIFPNNKRVQIDVELDSPLTARSLSLTPSSEPIGATCELQAADATGQMQTVRRFKCDRSNMKIHVGPMPQGPVTVSFPAVTSKHFRLVFSEFFGHGKDVKLAEIDLSGAARLESCVEKQLGKMHPTPLPLGDAYCWPQSAEPEAASYAVTQTLVQDLSKQLAADGSLAWDVPAGEWIVQRIGMVPTGTKNSPASPEGSGLEVDKLNRELVKQHFAAFIGQLLKRMPAADRKALTRVIADSYEMGSQNWTDGFADKFQHRYRYDPKPWLPVLSGRIVGSADQSERFLWDLRRLVADNIATEYVGGLREACAANGLGLWLENYGHWGFPSEFLKYGSESDRIGGEFWVTGDLGSIECRAASSCANSYGKPFVSAESFTGGPPFQNAPGALKARGDWSFCEGINHVVLHVNIHQPWEDKVPGVNAWFGTEFNRHNTWFEQSKAWIDYERRCCWMLQQGWRVADVAYFIGEDAPKMTANRKPDLPPGRDFDFINADVIEHKLTVKDGMLMLPHGLSYRLLVLPEGETMRPEILRKISDLIHAGATVAGFPPKRSPSLESFPACDEEVRKLTSEIWGTGPLPTNGERRVGAGQIVWGKPLEEVFASLGLPPDFQSAVPLRFTHRRDADQDLYFVSNPKSRTRTTTVALRAGERVPELWWPDSGRIERPATYDTAHGVVRMPLCLGPQASVFVRFHETPSSSGIASVTRNGEEVLGIKPIPARIETGGDNPNHFSFALWANPKDDTTLVHEANRGVVGMKDKRNEVFAAPHGNTFGGSGHAGAGLSVGTNGVCVFEHGASYYAPTLVHAAALTGWTHVAVVYRDGQPSLYLNGTLAHTGLKSEYIVHSGASQSGSTRFRGEVGEIETFARALTAVEVQDLAKTMARPADRNALPQLNVVSCNGAPTAVVTQNGEYKLQFVHGSVITLNVTSVPPVQEISGPWEVRFTPGWGAPDKMAFDQLIDWTQRPEEGIRYYSGKATYLKTFDLPNSEIRNPKSEIWLSLGEVHDIATVRVNGKAFTPLWLAPWRVDITSAVKPGTNQLEVEVVNAWNNRLVGDAKLPESQRRTWLAIPAVKPEAPLQAAGLLGPVTLQTVVKIPFLPPASASTPARKSN